MLARRGLVNPEELAYYVCYGPLGMALEALSQEARSLQQSAAYDESRGRRVVVEHRLARLAHPGIRQSRYFGRAKPKFQLYLAATVVNPTLVAGKLVRSGRAGPAAFQQLLHHPYRRHPFRL